MCLAIQALANEEKLNSEEITLKHAAQMLEKHNRFTAATIVRNEQITQELQRRAKRARTLCKVSHQDIRYTRFPSLVDALPSLSNA